MQDVEQFAEEKGLVDKVELLKKGALIAQDPANYENLDCLTDEEKEFLGFEAAHKWKHPIKLYFTIIICSIGAAVQGWDQTGYLYAKMQRLLHRSNRYQVQRSQSQFPKAIRNRQWRYSRRTTSRPRQLASRHRQRRSLHRFIIHRLLARGSCQLLSWPSWNYLPVCYILPLDAYRRSLHANMVSAVHY